MSTISIQEFEKDMRGVLARLGEGDALVLTENGLPIAEVKPVKKRDMTPRPIGLAKGQFTIPDDFNAPLPEEILRDFEPKKSDFAWLKYDPETLTSLRLFHDKLIDPNERDAALDDPANKGLVEQYYKHHDFMQSFWWEPEWWMTQMWRHPSLEQMRRQELCQLVEVYVQPLKEALDVCRGEAFYRQNKADIDALPEAIQEGVRSGRFGPLDTHEQRVKAMTEAIEFNKRQQSHAQPTLEPSSGQTNVNGTLNWNGPRSL